MGTLCQQSVNENVPICLLVLLGILVFPIGVLASQKEVLEVFKKYQELNEAFLNAPREPDRRSAFENYSENVYNPKLSEATNLVCRKKDRVILRMFLEVLIATRNSADEYPSWVLGDMFVCQPELVVSEYEKFESWEKKVLYGDLEFGFLNVTYKKEYKTPRYEYLKKTLESLSP